jgi:hypothetical protein
VTTKSPTQRSLAYLRGQGFFCTVVEHWFKRRRHDLWGFCDILALRGPGEVVAVQTTDSTNASHRIAKIRNHENLPKVLTAGIQVEVHGWPTDDQARDVPRVVAILTPQATLG